MSIYIHFYIDATLLTIRPVSAKQMNIIPRLHPYQHQPENRLPNQVSQIIFVQSRYVQFQTIDQSFRARAHEGKNFTHILFFPFQFKTISLSNQTLLVMVRPMVHSCPADTATSSISAYQVSGTIFVVLVLTTFHTIYGGINKLTSAIGLVEYSALINYMDRLHQRNKLKMKAYYFSITIVEPIHLFLVKIKTEARHSTSSLRMIGFCRTFGNK